MRLGLFLIAGIFALALLTNEPQQATAQSCAGVSAGCQGSSVGCAGEARRPVRGVLRRLSAVRPVRRLMRGCS